MNWTDLVLGALLALTVVNLTFTIERWRRSRR